MHQSVIGPGESGQYEHAESDDIEWELCCSAREASVGYVPFANLDFTRAAMEMGRTRVEQAEAERHS
jgi:hypothetical protein